MGLWKSLLNAGESGENYVRDKTIPSWAPDLRQQIKPQINNFEPTYNAHNGTNASASFIRGDIVLSARGVLFDQIDGLSGTRYWDDDLSNVADIQNSQYHGNPYSPNEDAFTEALWHALVGNRDRFGNEATPSLACLLSAEILSPEHAPPLPTPDTGDTDQSLRWNLHLWMKRNAKFLLRNGKPLGDFLQNNKAFELESEQYHQAIGRLVNFLWARRLITTKKGYIGVAPRPVRRGDIIAILLGCSAPLVLRPADRDTYEIVA